MMSFHSTLFSAIMIVARKLPSCVLASVRTRMVSTEAVSKLDKWIASMHERPLVVADYFNPHQLANLHATLPTTAERSRGRPVSTREISSTLPPGHHLVFFNTSNPEASLRADGSDADFGPPPPFSRRMWAGGSMRWARDHGSNAAVDARARARSKIIEVKKTGFEGSNPMVFVKQRIAVDYGVDLEHQLVEEERTHVYIPPSTGPKRSVKSVDGLPQSASFSYEFTTTPTTLFRFSALTFNGHYIHLDADYARSEGYEERLVHAPFSALMMLEALCFCHPQAAPLLKQFKYRAINPMVLNRRLVINGSWNSTRDSVTLWMLNEDGHVGMTGSTELWSPCPADSARCM